MASRSMFNIIYINPGCLFLPSPPSHSLPPVLPPVLPILILFAPSTVIYLSDLYLSTANKLR